uniref:non-specific serine/threonine protein kinase n=1 Tax=Heterorhabditis bacteriophora TaxID=37862 RepID=A0A1I7X0U6_HETBA
MTEVQIATVSQQVLRSIEFLHERRVIHRWYPILDCFRGMLNLIALRFQMIPNFFPVIARQAYDTRADIWSFGIMLIEMVEGEPPFFNEQPFQAMKRIRDEPAPKFSSNANVSPELAHMLSRCLVKDSEQRASATELLQHPFIKKAIHPSCICSLIQHH